MDSQAERREWLRVLSHAALLDLEYLWREIDIPHRFRVLRHPEPGLAMVRGRADGSGRPFNVGEATVSRCTVATTDSQDGRELMGVGYVLGRNKRHAELTARFDALFQDSGQGQTIRAVVLPPLRAKRADAVAKVARKTDSTRVEFFTMVRGD